MQHHRYIIRAGLLAIAVSQLPAAHAQPAGPQTTLATPSPESYTNNSFDRSDGVKITGDIAKVEMLDTGPILWVFARTAAKEGYGVRPGTETRGKGMLWRIEGPALAKSKDPSKFVKGAEVTASGKNWDVKTCDPSCRMSADKLSLK